MVKLFSGFQDYTNSKTVQNLSTALTFKCSHVGNSSCGSLSSPGAGSHTNVVCGPRVQSVQSVGNTPRIVVLHWHNPVLCTWTLRYIAHLFKNGREEEEEEEEEGEEEGKEQKGWRGKKGGRGKRREEGDEQRDVCIIFISLLLPQSTYKYNTMQHETLT